MMRWPFSRNTLLIAFVITILTGNARVIFAQPQPDSLEFYLKRHLRGHNSSVFGLALNEDRSLLLSCGVQKRVVLWETKTWKQLATNEEAQGKLLDIQFATGKKKAFAVGDPKSLYVFSIPDLKLINTLELPFRGTRISVRKDSRLVAVAGIHGDVAIIDVVKGLVSAHIKGHVKEVIGVTWSKDGEMLYTGGYAQGDRTCLRAWKHRTRRLSSELVELSSPFKRLRLNGSGDHLLLANEKEASIYDLNSKKLIQKWSQPEDDNKFADLATWPERQAYVTTSMGGKVHVWKPDVAEPIATFSATRYDTYRVIPLDKNRILVCTRTREKAIAIWAVKKPNSTGDPNRTVLRERKTFKVKKGGR